MLEDYTRHQQGIIKRYYKNQDALLLQRLSELVTDLYLAEGKKRQKLWEVVATALRKLELPEGQVAHLVAQADVKVLAEVVQGLNQKK